MRLSWRRHGADSLEGEWAGRVIAAGTSRVIRRAVRASIEVRPAGCRAHSAGVSVVFLGTRSSHIAAAGGDIEIDTDVDLAAMRAF